MLFVERYFANMLDCFPIYSAYLVIYFGRCTFPFTCINNGVGQTITHNCHKHRSLYCKWTAKLPYSLVENKVDCEKPPLESIWPSIFNKPGALQKRSTPPPGKRAFKNRGWRECPQWVHYFDSLGKPLAEFGKFGSTFEKIFSAAKK